APLFAQGVGPQAAPGPAATFAQRLRPFWTLAVTLLALLLVAALWLPKRMSSMRTQRRSH
ncbi:MAG: hypothetical protein AAB339_00420, partial [Elusimicrobiota bacterium]